MNLKGLREVGLSEKEIKVYVGLLELGQSLASKISEKTEVERTVTYHILSKLIKKGLVSYVIKENRRYFTSLEPVKLRLLLKEKEELLNEDISNLIKLKPSDKSSLSVEVFSGKEGFKVVMEDLLAKNKPYFIIGYTGKSTEIAPFWYIHWNKRRVKNKIRRYLLIKKGDENLKSLRYPSTYVRIMPEKTIHQSKSSIIIYGEDKVLLFLPLSEFHGIRIKNKETYEAYKSYFDTLWKTAKR